MFCIVTAPLLAASALALLFDAAVHAGRAQNSDAVTAARLRDAALKDDWGYRLLETLTTTIGPRLVGTARETRAATSTKGALKAAGFDAVRRESFPIVAWLRGREEAKVIAPASQRLVVTALGASVATPARAERRGLGGDSLSRRAIRSRFPEARR